MALPGAEPAGQPAPLPRPATGGRRGGGAAGRRLLPPLPPRGKGRLLSPTQAPLPRRRRAGPAPAELRPGPGATPPAGGRRGARPPSRLVRPGRSAWSRARPLFRWPRQPQGAAPCLRAAAGAAGSQRALPSRSPSPPRSAPPLHLPFTSGRRPQPPSLLPPHLPSTSPRVSQEGRGAAAAAAAARGGGGGVLAAAARTGGSLSVPPAGVTAAAAGGGALFFPALRGLLLSAARAPAAAAAPAPIDPAAHCATPPLPGLAGCRSWSGPRSQPRAAAAKRRGGPEGAGARSPRVPLLFRLRRKVDVPLMAQAGRRLAGVYQAPVVSGSRFPAAGMGGRPGMWLARGVNYVGQRRASLEVGGLDSQDPGLPQALRVAAKGEPGGQRAAPGQELLLPASGPGAVSGHALRCDLYQLPAPRTPAPLSSAWGHRAEQRRWPPGVPPATSQPEVSRPGPGTPPLKVEAPTFPGAVAPGTAPGGPTGPG